MATRRTKKVAAAKTDVAQTTEQAVPEQAAPEDWPLEEGGYFSFSSIRREVRSEGGAVSELQRRLGVADTGVFDDATWAAVKELQDAKGLPVSGVVDVTTWAALPVPPAEADGEAEQTPAEDADEQE